MKYLIIWLIIPLLWALGGWRWRYWRRGFIPLIFTIISWSSAQFWAILSGGLIYGSTTLGYGDDQTDKPRWLCGFAYAFPFIILAWINHKWLLWIIQMIISAAGSELVNNWLNAKLKTRFKDRITEFLTAFCAYCLIPFIL